jgi:hypothetical protein
LHNLQTAASWKWWRFKCHNRLTMLFVFLMVI